MSTERLVGPQVNMNSDRYLDEKVNSFKNAWGDDDDGEDFIEKTKTNPSREVGRGKFDRNFFYHQLKKNSQLWGVSNVKLIE